MRANSFQLIKFCCTRPDSYLDDPTAETKSIGLQATPTNQTAGPLAPIHTSQVNFNK